MLRILRRGALVLAALAAITALLLAMVWVGFPQLAPAVAGTLLERRGIELERLDIRRPQRYRIHVAQLELRDRDGRFAIRARRLVLSWASFRSLLRDGPEQAMVDTIDVDLAPSAKTPAGAAPVTDASWLGELPVARLGVRHLHLALLPAPDAQRVTATGSFEVSRRQGRFEGLLRSTYLPAPLLLTTTLDVHSHLQVEARESSLAPPFLDLQGRLTGAPGFEGRARIAVTALSRWLAVDGEHLQGDVELDLAADLGPVPALTLARDSAARIRLDRDANRVDLEVSAPADVTFKLDDQARISSAHRLALSLTAHTATTATEGRFDILEPRLGMTGEVDAYIDGAGVLTWAEGHAEYAIHMPLRAFLARRELEIAAGSSMALEVLRHAGFELSAATVTATAPARVDASGSLLEAAELTLAIDDPDRMTLAAGLTLQPDLDAVTEIHVGELRLVGNDTLTALLPTGIVPRSGRVEFTGRARRSHSGQLQGSWSTHWHGVGLDVDAARLRGASGSAAFELDHDRLKLHAMTASFDQLAWRPAAAGSRETSAQRGALSATGVLTLASEPWRIATWTVDADLEADALASAQLRGRRLSAAVRTDGSPQNPSFVGRVRLDLADAGITVGDTDCHFAFHQPGPLELEGCSAKVLGGELRLPQGTLDPVTGDGYLPIAITGVDLSTVLALMQDPALDGQGTLDGSLPLRLQGWRPLVEEGRLAARIPGGSLTYATPNHLLADIEQPALRLALRAVRDLRYQRLDSRVDYGADGTLSLGVDLLGSNPEIEGGRPIQLNLNVTQNLLQLLRSLQLSEQLERDIERRLERIQQ